MSTAVRANDTGSVILGLAVMVGMVAIGIRLLVGVRAGTLRNPDLHLSSAVGGGEL